MSVVKRVPISIFAILLMLFSNLQGHAVDKRVYYHPRLDPTVSGPLSSPREGFFAGLFGRVLRLGVSHETEEDFPMVRPDEPQVDFTHRFLKELKSYQMTRAATEKCS